jgi:hypothetical protein
MKNGDNGGCAEPRLRLTVMKNEDRIPPGDCDSNFMPVALFPGRFTDA